MMDTGWRTASPSVCKSKVVTSFSGVPRSSLLFDTSRSVCTRPFSASASAPSISWRVSDHRQSRRGQCFCAVTSAGGQKAMETDTMGSAEEFMEWRALSSRFDALEDAVTSDDVNYAPAIPSEKRDEESESSSEGLMRGEDACEVVYGQSNGARRGWRRLASAEDVRRPDFSKAYMMRKSLRRSKLSWRRFKAADDAPIREGKEVVENKRDPNLEDLFKTLASRRSDRSGAVEKYFGGDLSEKISPSERKRREVERMMKLSVPVGQGNDLVRRVGEVVKPRLSNVGRLKINLDLDLYRAKCLKEEGRLVEAEAILRECIRDWQDDGRPYLALSVLGSPQSSDQTSPEDDGFTDELNGRIAAGLANKSLLAEDDLIVEDAVDGEGVESASGPAVLGVGERLKINLDLDLYEAKCCKFKGRVDESQAILKKCIRDWPDDGRPYVALGKQLLEQNKIQATRSLYESGCQACRGENPYIWQAWAILEEKCGDVTKARKYFDAAVAADKKHVAAWHGWAKLELRAGNVKRAKSLLMKGVRYCGPNEYIFQTLGLLEYREGNTEQARLLLSKATKHNPRSAPSWLAWALMEADINFIDTARRLFQRAIEASPKNRYTWQAWARFEAKQGRKDRARELFQRGRELNPRDAILLQAFALFEYDCGRPGIARDLFRKSLTCDSTHQPTWIGWGWMEWKQRNLSVARELYHGAIQADSRSLDAARAFQAWGVLEDGEGDSGLARELFRCALKIDSQNVPTWMAWAAMEEREGRSVRADEIRNLFLQQRTEVVEGPFNVDFSDLLAPAIDKIKGFFRAEQQSAWLGQRSPAKTPMSTGQSQDATDVDITSSGGSLGTTYSREKEFDVDSFLVEKFPRKYRSVNTLKSSPLNSHQENTVKGPV